MEVCTEWSYQQTLIGGLYGFNGSLPGQYLFTGAQYVILDGSNATRTEKAPGFLYQGDPLADFGLGVEGSEIVDGTFHYRDVYHLKYDLVNNFPINSIRNDVPNSYWNVKRDDGKSEVKTLSSGDDFIEQGTFSKCFDRFPILEKTHCYYYEHYRFVGNRLMVVSGLVVHPYASNKPVPLAYKITLEAQVWEFNGTSKVAWGSFNNYPRDYLFNLTEAIDSMTNIAESMFTELSSMTLKGSRTMKRYTLHGFDPSTLPPLDFVSGEQLFPITDRNPDWSQLSAEAIQSIGFNSNNGVAYALDAIKTRSTIESVIQSIKKVKGGKFVSVASLYLALHYGLRLTIADSKDYLSVLQDSDLYVQFRAQSHCEWESNDTSYSARYQIHYRPYSELRQTIASFLAKFDLLPDLGNAWDLIPWSFVLDWVTNIGSTLESIDSWYKVKQTKEIVCCSQSITCTKKVDISSSGYHTTVPVQLYYRRYRKDVIPPPINLSLTIDPKGLSRHLTEAGALVIQQLSGKH